MAFVGPMTSSFVQTCLSEVKKDSTKELLRQEILEPMINDVNKRYAPYFSCLVLLLVIIAVLLMYLVRK